MAREKEELSIVRQFIENFLVLAGKSANKISKPV